MQLNIPENILNTPERYTLTIRVHPEQYSFSLYSLLEGGSFFYQPILQGKDISPLKCFQQFFFENDWLSLPYRQVKVINHSYCFTFVPSLIFKEQDKQQYLDFNFSEYEGKILTQSLHQPDLTLIHVLPQVAYDFFQRTFVKVEYLHHLSPQVAYCWNKNRTNNANKVYANIQLDSLDILVFSHNQFLLGNSFNIQGGDDYLYYLLLIWKQFELDQSRDFLYVAGGESDLHISRIRRLQKFIHNVAPLNLIPEGYLLHAISSMPFDMASIVLCEL